MSIIVDGERAKKWVGFARSKLNALKNMGGGAKVLAVDGYRIKVSTDPDKIQINAPPAVVVSHIEYEAGVGAEYLYYAEPYGASAVRVGAYKGLKFDDGTVMEMSVFQTQVDPPVIVGTTLYNDMPGYGVVFPTAAEVYFTSFCAYTASLFSIVTAMARWAYAAPKSFKFSGNFNEGNYAMAGWMAVVDGQIFLVTSYLGGETIIRSLTATDQLSRGVSASLFEATFGTRSTDTMYVYPHLDGVRMVMFAEVHNNHGAYFFQVTVNKNDAGERVSLRVEYVGRCLVPAAGDVPFVENAVGGVVKTTRLPAVINHKGSPVADGLGGVNAISRHTTATTQSTTTASITTYSGDPLVATTTITVTTEPTYTIAVPLPPWVAYATTAVTGDTTVTSVRTVSGTTPVITMVTTVTTSYPDHVYEVVTTVIFTLETKSYNLTPGAALAYTSLSFPAVAEIADVQVIPLLFKGTDTNLCVLEKIADGVEGKIVSIHKGLSPWTAVPMPVDELIAMRPVCVSVARTVLIGLVWVPGGVKPGTYFVEFDTKKHATEWVVRGKIADIRMTRPIVGFFGAHAYTKLAQDFPGVFPVTPKAATHQYNGL